MHPARHFRGHAQKGRGRRRRRHPGRPPRRPASPINATGAGDTFAGTLLARMAGSGWYAPAVAAGLEEAVEAAATGPARAVALSELAYLLNDNVEVITAPPQPEV